MSSALTRRHLLLGAAALPLLASNTFLVGAAVAQSRNVTASNYSQLASAISNARAGDIITLSNGGSFGGNRLTVSARGTSSQPIIIRAQSRLGAIVPNGFRLDGEHITLTGIDFTHGGTEVFVQIAGRNNTVEQCRFRAHGRHIELLSGDRGRVMYCEFSCPSRDQSAPNTLIIRTGWHSSARHTNGEIGYCYFTNMPHKTSNYHERQRVAIGLGLNGITGTWRTNHYVHHCLLENTGDCELEVKTRGNRIEYCTIISTTAFFNQRYGGENVFRGCWAEGSRGFDIFGDRNKLIGCKTVGLACEFNIYAGDQSPTATSNGHPQSVDTVLAHCDGRSTSVGRTWNSNMKLPATRTRLEAHTGTIRYGTHSGTATPGSSNEPVIRPTKLSRSAVGPTAKSYAATEAPSQPSGSTQQASNPPAQEPAPQQTQQTAEQTPLPQETPEQTATSTFDFSSYLADRNNQGSITQPTFTSPSSQTPTQTTTSISSLFDRSSIFQR